MEEIIDISVIIPVHSLAGDNDKELLTRAIESVKKQIVKVKEIMIVATPDVALMLPGSTDYVIMVNNGESDFCSQVNYGVSQVETKYFAILEFDDEFSDYYFKNVDKYIKAYPNVSGYLPITVLVNSKHEATQYVNEAVWAQGFSEHLGFLDMASLLQNDNFMISGGVFIKEAYEEVGGLKGDIKLYFNYEFLLRFINSDFTTMVIPKLGYTHLIDRDGSLFRSYTLPNTGIKYDEAKFFKETAKKEYFFNPNQITRKIKYSPATA